MVVTLTSGFWTNSLEYVESIKIVLSKDPVLNYYPDTVGCWKQDLQEAVLKGQKIGFDYSKYF